MKTALTLLAVTTAFFAPSRSASQSGVESPPAVARTGIQESEGELSTNVLLHLDRGDQLSSRLNFAAAAREYRQAAEIARREGHLPSWTSWKLANAYFNDNNLLGAATALDQLADEAALVGDLPVEALALFNSAWLNSKGGRNGAAVSRVARLKGLLRSQYMPVAIRDQLNERLSAPSEVATY
ncbi:MAG TPA: hypothetical protein VN803_11325 [Gemmatimonadales bacterium]|nr:hypothetical protein [Gemmatimonadales bacterium]